MSWVEVKYISLISPRLEKFKRKSNALWNFRCPFCGDSETHSQKTRGYLFEKKNSILFFCHNCHFSCKFETFLHRLDLALYNEYKLEILKEYEHTPEVMESFKTEKRFDTSEAFESLYKLKKISQLSHDHPAKIYVKNRLIPNPFHAILRWCPKFCDWTNSLIPEKFGSNSLAKDDGRVIIPYFNEHNHFFAYQGRALDHDVGKLRYIAISLSPSEPMLYGLNTVVQTRPIPVLEGPIDALFLPNSVAIGGSNFGSLRLKLPIDRLIMIYDNEPRSKDTKKKIFHAIENGFKVVIWPDNIDPKDINAMVLGGYSVDHISWVIDNNIFSGLKAKLRLNEWSKV